MRPKRSLAAQENVDELVARIGRLQPTSPRQWGTLTPNEMLCHLADAFLVMLGDRPAVSSDRPLVVKWIAKWLALHTSLPWPHGFPTSREVDPHRDGTKPVDFEEDRQRVIALLRRFSSPETQYGRHPGFGSMTREEWLLWGYGHVDHHLRQFGL
jgi:hypothetical protein